MLETGVLLNNVRFQCYFLSTVTTLSMSYTQELRSTYLNVWQKYEQNKILQSQCTISTVFTELLLLPFIIIMQHLTCHVSVIKMTNRRRDRS